MIPPMRAALTDHHADGNTVRQVVFLTDGCIGNEQQLFDTITSMRGRSRVFMVGIGSAPNSYLMTRAPNSAAAPSPISARSSKSRAGCANCSASSKARR
jgi:hypothetical protein